MSERERNRGREDASEKENQSTKRPYLVLAFPQIRLHLLQLFGRFRRRHVVALLEHLQPKQGKQRRRDVVRVNARNDGGGHAEHRRQHCHQGQGGDRTGKHRQPGMPHGHDGRDEERLVAQLRHDDDRERRDEGVYEAHLGVEETAGLFRGEVAAADVCILKWGEENGIFSISLHT